MPALYPDAVGADHTRRFTKALADAAASVPLDTPVPTCEGWRMADLVWHLFEVQDFWIHVIGGRPNAGPATYDRLERPADSRLIARLRNAAVGLDDVLSRASADDIAWSWSDDHTVAFTLRRQTHEAYIHAVDGVLAANRDLPAISPELAADGVDEVINVMLPAPEAGFTGTATVRTTDTGDTWTIAVPAGEATIAGAANDLYLWIWGRAKTWPLTVTGDAQVADSVRDLLANNQ